MTVLLIRREEHVNKNIYTLLSTDTLPTAATVAADRGQAGSMAFITDTGDVHKYSGTVWKKISTDGAEHVTTNPIAGVSGSMLTDATGTGTAFSTQLAGAGLPSEANYLATLGATAAAAATATVTIYGSRVAMATAIAAEKSTIAVLSLSGTGVTNNNTVISTDQQNVGAHRFPYIWAEVTAISGTGAKVQAWRIT